MKKNFLTFDIEEWYHANYDDVDFSLYADQPTNLEENIDRIIEICDTHNVKSTCFVLGNLAEKKPHLIKKLHDAGHEIASHSYSHKLVYTMTPEEFREDLKKSCEILENITGEKVKGYRAPSWSVKQENLEWYYKILEEEGLIYSSSVYPAYTYLYGIPGFNENPHYPVINGEKTKILEIPVSVFGFKDKKLGFAGGFYMRFFPTWFIKFLINRKNQQNMPVFIYLHPREIDLNQPILELKPLEKFIHYHDIKGTEKKLNKLIKSYSDSLIKCKDFIL